MKKLTYAVAVVLFFVAGFFAAQRYQQNQLVNAISPRLKNASLRLMNSTRQELKETSNVTYEEYFTKAQSDITDVDQHILQVQTLASSSNSSVTYPAIEYLEALQDVQRAALARYRKSLNHSLQSEKSIEAVRAARAVASSDADEVEYLEFHIRRLNSVKAELSQSISEYDEARLHFADKLSELRRKRAAAEILYSGDALVTEMWIDAVTKGNQRKISDSIEQ